MAAADAAPRSMSGLSARWQRLIPREPRADLRRRLGRHQPWEEGYELVPPDGGGLPTGPPDFVGVGAQQCGTNWWYGLIAAHPDVAHDAGRPPGLHYFSHFGLRACTEADRARYHRFFPRRAGQQAGEWTASYAAQLWVAPLLADAAPDARLLFLVRDPVERFRLGLARITETRVPNVGAALADVADRGFYGVQLRRLLEWFPAERILVQQLERCIDDVGGELSATYRFLGLDDELSRRAAPAAPRSPEVPGAPTLDRATGDRLAEMYAGDVRDLAGLAPGLDPERWPWFARRREA
jgi:hypothetical protein